jgi:hypothetical protein
MDQLQEAGLLGEFARGMEIKPKRADELVLKYELWKLLQEYCSTMEFVTSSML